MKGYAYIDLDNELVYKTRSYIEDDNPAFWNQNSHLLVRKFSFDTDDKSSMIRMLRTFQDMSISPDRVKNFCSCINFDLKDLKRAN